MPMLRRVTLTTSAIALALFVTAVRSNAQTAPAADKRDIVAEVRAQITKNDFDGAEKTVRAFAKEKGWTPEALEALSWMGRGNLAAKRLDEASRFAYETERLSLAAL